MKTFFKKTTDGFTLVEFIVIMSIFAIMVGVALFNFTGFRSNVITENLAHDIAITLRGVQAGGGASQSIINSPEDEQYRGAYFKYNGSGFDKSIVLFIDEDRNGVYNRSEDGDPLDIITIESSDVIRGIVFADECNEGGFSVQCEGTANFAPVNEDISIVFGRFNTVPQFSVEDDKPYLIISVGPADLEEKGRIIIISRLGQISVY